MAWWGLNGINILQPDQLELCRERGFVGYTVGASTAWLGDDAPRRWSGPAREPTRCM